MNASSSGQDQAHNTRQRWSWLLPVLLAVAAYAPAPFGGFVWDDTIVFETQMPALTEWWHPLWPPAGIHQWPEHYYRPVPLASFMVDRAVFGGTAAGYHISNVAFHAVTTLGLWLLLRRLLAGTAAAALGALAGASVFAVHPIHTESVSWINGRTDLLAAMFMLPAVVLALRWRDEKSVPALAGVVLLFLLALLSKEVALAGLAVIPAALWLAPATEAMPGRAFRTWTGLALALVMATAAALALRISAGTGARGSAIAIDFASGAEALARSLAYLVIKPVWPWPQSNFVPDAALPPVWAGIVAALAVCAIAAWSWRRWTARGDGLPALALTWFGATVAPALAAALLGVAETSMAERFLYLPSVALAMAVAGGSIALAETGQRKIAGGLVGAIVIAYGVATVARGFAWQDDLSLWSDAVKKMPAEGLPLNELAVAYASRGELDRAFELWQQASGLHNTAENAATVEANLGNYYLRRRDYAGARQHLEAAVKLHWALPNAHHGLGRTLAVQARDIPLTPDSAALVRAMLERSSVHYAAAVQMSAPSAALRIEYAELLVWLGDLTRQMGETATAVERFSAARESLERALSVDPAARERPNVAALQQRIRQGIPE
jgi:tetratricopeptide (TPR) repeat protein